MLWLDVEQNAALRERERERERERGRGGDGSSGDGSGGAVGGVEEGRGAVAWEWEVRERVFFH